MVIKSTTPVKLSSAPIGNCKGTALAPNISLTCFTTFKKSAPLRSILFTNPIRGTLYLLACLQTVSLCGSTPLTAQNNANKPSNTRRLRSTSTVKSTWPGVSIMLNLYCFVSGVFWPCTIGKFQKQVVAAEVIVIPLSCSCAIQSIVAPPSCTSPILWFTPV